MPWFYLLIAIFAEVVGTSALKASAGMTKLAPAAVVLLGYGAAFYLLSLTLAYIPVGVAYAIWSGVGIVLISLLGNVSPQSEHPTKTSLTFFGGSSFSGARSSHQTNSPPTTRIQNRVTACRFPLPSTAP